MNERMNESFFYMRLKTFTQVDAYSQQQVHTKCSHKLKVLKATIQPTDTVPEKNQDEDMSVHSKYR